MSLRALGEIVQHRSVDCGGAVCRVDYIHVWQYGMRMAVPADAFHYRTAHRKAFQEECECSACDYVCELDGRMVAGIDEGHGFEHLPAKRLGVVLFAGLPNARVIIVARALAHIRPERLALVAPH